jgi:ferredoxin-type protein NapG
MTERQDGGKNTISRRALVTGGIGAGVMLAIGGGARLAVGSEIPLRPPGGQDEDHLLANCIRCDRCRSACPNNAIGVASINDGILMARTPKMEYRKGYCDFCKGASGEGEGGGGGRGRQGAGSGAGEAGGAGSGAGGLLCVLNCPTGALLEFDHRTEWISPAVVDAEECIAFAKQGGCRVCADKCPYDAISLDAYLRPVVDEARCNGCGHCEYVCPSHSYRAYSGSAKRGINVVRSSEPRPAAAGAGQHSGQGREASGGDSA